MSKIILVVSPTPTHPQTAGNRARIYNLLSSLVKNGYEVHFLYIQHEKTSDLSEMRKCWGNKFHTIEYTKPKSRSNKASTVISNSRNGFFAKIVRKLLSKFQKIRYRIEKDLKYVYLIDEWYDDSADRVLAELSKFINPDVVIVEYVFISRALDCFGPETLKIIDTHDIFANRHRLYLKNEKTPRWFSTTVRQENIGLRRADIVLTIQDREADLLKQRLSGKSTKVITVGHIVDLAHKDILDSNSHRIIFVASANPINLDGLSFFLNQVFTDVKKELPNARLVLAGSICEAIPDEPSRYTKLGKVDSLRDAYETADLAISPILFGTGLKIKSIEALGYSMPLVTTPAGAAGIEEGANEAFRVAGSPEEFVKAILEILASPVTRRQLSQNAYEFARRWNQRSIQALEDAILSRD